LFGIHQAPSGRSLDLPEGAFLRCSRFGLIMVGPPSANIESFPMLLKKRGRCFHYFVKIWIVDPDNEGNKAGICGKAQFKIHPDQKQTVVQIEPLAELPIPRPAPAAAIVTDLDYGLFLQLEKIVY